MVLESIISPTKAEKRPWELFSFGLVYTSISILISMWVFDQYIGMVMVFLAVLPCVPLMYNTMKLEEWKGITTSFEWRLLKEHGKAISFILFLFLGCTAAFTLWYVFLPPDLTAATFKVQMDTMKSLNEKISGGYWSTEVFMRIILNNIRVMIFCLLFSFLYGAGAIFIIIWNASVVGTAAGNFIRVRIAEYASEFGMQKIGAYFYISSLSIFRYAIHGIPEIIAYIIAGLAGGIFSAAIITHDITTKRFERILIDVANLILISIAFLIFAAVLEVFIIPRFF